MAPPRPVATARRLPPACRRPFANVQLSPSAHARCCRARRSRRAARRSGASLRRRSILCDQTFQEKQNADFQYLRTPPTIMDNSKGHGVGRGDRGQHGRGIPPSHRGAPPMARGEQGDLSSRSSGLRLSSGDPRDSGGELGFGSGAVQVYAPNTPAQADARLSDREQDARVSRF
ncbi:hypothetical protein DFH11DRAFT_1599298 [Phellopilus nigrolimitatus]|nr:hypothetical protein DFH11DRAFT_1599298 [Phellopilus nigrolimitatus]